MGRGRIVHIPNGWQQLRLSEILSLVYGEGLTGSLRESGNVPVMGSNGPIGSHDYALVQGPGIVIGRKGSIGKVAWVDSDFWPIDTTYYVERKTEHDLRWLYYLLDSLRLGRLNSATGVPGLNRDDVCAVKVLVPPYREAKRIAICLDVVDTVIERTRAVIEQTRRLKTALLQDLLTNGLPGRHRKLVNHPRLGRIPANWRVAPLGRLCVSAVDGPFGSNLKTEHYSQSGVRVIRLQNIAVGEFDDSDRAFVPGHHFEGLKEYEALPGDLLIASMGDESHPAGRACLVPDRVCPAMIKADCFRFRVDAEQASPQYLMWFMNSYMARREIDRGSHGQTRTRLNLTNAKKVCVPIPDLPEQKIIAKVIDALHRRELSERKELIGLDNVQSALRHGLLTGKIRVEARGARDA